MAMRNERFVLWRSRTLFGRRWYFHLRGKNGEVVIQSEGYRDRRDAERAIEIVKGANADTPIQVMP